MGMPVIFYKMALANILRYSRRSLLTGTVMMSSVVVLFFAASMGEAFYRQLVNVGINTVTGHICIIPQKADFDLVHPQGGSIPWLERSGELEDLVARDPHLKFFDREIIYQLILAEQGDTFFPGALIGVEAEKAPAAFSGAKLMMGQNLVNSLQKGVLLSPNAKEYFREITQRDLVLGEAMYMLGTDAFGMLDGVVSSFQGVLLTMPIFGENVVVTDIGHVQELLGWEQGRYSLLKLQLRDAEMAEEVAAQLRTKAAAAGLEVKVLTWKELGGFFYYIALLGRFMVLLLMVTIAMIAAFTISSTMTMSVKERTREIGTAMAMGMHGADLVRLFLIEALVLAAISAFIGCFLSYALVAYFGQQGILHGLSIVAEGALYPVFDGVMLFLVCMWILVIALLGGTYPALVAAKLDPITALRYV